MTRRGIHYDCRALDVGPLKLLTILLSGGKAKSPPDKPGAKRHT
jgi:hypothetical protein